MVNRRFGLIILVAMLITIVPFHASSGDNWYVSMNPSQIKLVLGPDNSSYIETCLSHARHAVYAEVYEITCTAVTDDLINLAQHGVEVYLVLSGHVYGGIPSDENECVSRLNSSGVHVRFQYNFTYVHSKVFVIDNSTVILGSMNPTYYGFNVDKSVDLVIQNSTIAKVYATIILNDYRNVPTNSVNYPGIVVSPINSDSRISTLLSQPGTLYIAMEELYPSSDLFSEISSHNTIIGVVSTYSEDSEASSQFGLAQDKDMVAKVIVVGDYVYVGSVNLDSTSLTENRELGIIVKDPQLASQLEAVISSWGGHPYHPSFFDKYKEYIAISVVVILIILAFVIRKYRKQ